MNLPTKQKETHRLRKLTYGCLGGEECGHGIVREVGITIYTLLYLKQATNKFHTAQESLHNVMWQPGWKGSLGRMDTCLCIDEFLCYSLETITSLFTN